MRAVNRQGRNDHIDAGSVGESGVNHGRRFVHAPSDRRNNLIDDAHQVRVILEDDFGFFQKAGALNVNFPGAIHQNVADRRVLQQWRKRPQTEDFIQDLER